MSSTAKKRSEVQTFHLNICPDSHRQLIVIKDLWIVCHKLLQIVFILIQKYIIFAATLACDNILRMGSLYYDIEVILCFWKRKFTHGNDADNKRRQMIGSTQFLNHQWQQQQEGEKKWKIRFSGSFQDFCKIGNIWCNTSRFRKDVSIKNPNWNQIVRSEFHDFFCPDMLYLRMCLRNRQWQW